MGRRVLTGLMLCLVVGCKGDPGASKGTISGKVKDSAGAAIAGASIQTVPGSATTTSGNDGTFTLSDLSIGSYAVTASKAGYADFTLASVGVVANGTTNVSLVMQVASNATGTITGKVTDATANAGPLAGVTVTAEGAQVTATTASDGTFTLNGVAPGPTFLIATAPSKAYLDGETRYSVNLPPGGKVTDVAIVLSARPTDSARYWGSDNAVALGCAACHIKRAATVTASAHGRSLSRIPRDGSGHAKAGAFKAMLNPTLKSPRIVMVPLDGTISIAAASNAVVGTGTSFTTQVVVGDKLGYMPVGLGWYTLGTVASITDNTHLTLGSNATFAPTVTSVSGVKFSTQAKSLSYTHMMPEDSKDIVAPAWPGVKATNPNYDANDPCIYGNAPAGGSCAAGGTTKYADGQVNVYICNLKDGVTYTQDEYVQKFAGQPYTCSDGSIYNAATNPNPAVPMVRISVIYGGQGDKDAQGAPHPNMGVFKQRFQGILSDVKAAAAWNYTEGKDLDSLTLPIQVLESGDRVNGGFRMNGYHPTEQKFPGESWSQRTRTFSHGCAGCHNVGLKIDWDMVTVTLPFGRDGAPDNSPFTFAAIKTYGFIDENISCENCHGPGSEHVTSGGGRGNRIINPKYLTAESERQLCGQCHAYDDATNAEPAQDYGFEFPWNSNFKDAIGGGAYVPGVYQVGDFFDNWMERMTDDEASWDPAANGGKVYGQAHRQQYIMLAQSMHSNNPYWRISCTSCHDPHSLFHVTQPVHGATDQYTLDTADHRNNVACLSCHAAVPGPFQELTQVDVANIHVGSGGVAKKNDQPFTATEEEITASSVATANAVGRHMLDRANMMAAYDPTNDALPLGRCTSCHMPKVAKSGGYRNGVDINGAQAVLEGDQGSHVFDIIWPWQAGAIARAGPTFQSGYNGQFVSATGVKYDVFAHMPNSCSNCHVGARQASLVCPDSTEIWPSYWPLSEHRSDAFWSSCFTTVTAP